MGAKCKVMENGKHFEQVYWCLSVCIGTIYFCALSYFVFFLSTA